jgi:hypothetical protein
MGEVETLARLLVALSRKRTERRSRKPTLVRSMAAVS